MSDLRRVSVLTVVLLVLNGCATKKNQEYGQIFSRYNDGDIELILAGVDGTVTKKEAADILKDLVRNQHKSKPIEHDDVVGTHVMRLHSKKSKSWTPVSPVLTFSGSNKM